VYWCSEEIKNVCMFPKHMTSELMDFREHSKSIGSKKPKLFRLGRGQMVISFIKLKWLQSKNIQI
jgi:hypothetical protein